MTSNIIQQLSDEFSEIAQQLHHQRQELSLQLHLFSMDSKQRWHELEHDYQKFKATSQAMLNDTEVSADDIAETYKFLGEGIRLGYQRITDGLSRDK